MDGGLVVLLPLLITMMSCICAALDRLQSTLSYYPLCSVGWSAKEGGLGGGGGAWTSAHTVAAAGSPRPGPLFPQLQSHF